MRFRILASIVSASLSVSAQSKWQALPAPFTNTDHSVSYDTLRNEVHVEPCAVNARCTPTSAFAGA